MHRRRRRRLQLAGDVIRLHTEADGRYERADGHGQSEYAVRRKLHLNPQCSLEAKIPWFDVHTRTARIKHVQSADRGYDPFDE